MDIKAMSYRYQLVSLPPPDDVVCPICLDIVVEPYQLTCCGQHLCKRCSQNMKMACPFCRGKYQVSRDKYFERNTLNRLQVYCEKYEEGCEWEGELGDMDKHLQVCPCVEEECPYQCDERCTRQLMDDHKLVCPQRPYQCEYCGYESTYTEVTDVHVPVCDRAPVLCPNECEAIITRKTLPDHVEKECPLQIVSCEFNNVCHMTMVRKDLPQHFTEYAQHHTALMTKKMNNELMKMLQDKDRQLEEKDRQLKEKDRQIMENNQQLKILQHKLDLLLVANRDIIEMRGFGEKLRKETRWYSPPYYLHGGYKMCFEVDLKNNNGGKDLRIDHYIMKGPFGDSLQWPFTGKVMLQVIDQRHGSNHYNYEYDYSLDDSKGKRVTSGDRGGHYEPYTTRLLLSQLSNDGYLLNDTLKFAISST